MNCGHETCRCKVTEAFCSDHCREHAGQRDLGGEGCGCGHAACETPASSGSSETGQ